MTLEFAQDLYFRELDRRTALDAAPTLRIGAIALIAGAFSVYSTKYSVTGNFLSWLFILGGGGVIVCSVLSIIWIIRSYVGYRYGYLSSPVALLEHYRKLEALPKSSFPAGVGARETFDVGLI